MSKPNSQKKAASNDWDPADIVAALRKAGWSLRRLSKHHKYASEATLHIALHRRWPKAQRLIASAIGERPEAIWPSRYTDRENARDPASTNYNAASGTVPPSKTDEVSA